MAYGEFQKYQSKDNRVEFIASRHVTAKHILAVKGVVSARYVRVQLCKAGVMRLKRCEVFAPKLSAEQEQIEKKQREPAGSMSATAAAPAAVAPVASAASPAAQPLALRFFDVVETKGSPGTIRFASDARVAVGPALIGSRICYDPSTNSFWNVPNGGMNVLPLLCLRRFSSSRCLLTVEDRVVQFLNLPPSKVSAKELMSTPTTALATLSHPQFGLPVGSSSIRLSQLTVALLATVTELSRSFGKQYAAAGVVNPAALNFRSFCVGSDHATYSAVFRLASENVWPALRAAMQKPPASTSSGTSKVHTSAMLMVFALRVLMANLRLLPSSMQRDESTLLTAFDLKSDEAGVDLSQSAAAALGLDVGDFIVIISSYELQHLHKYVSFSNNVVPLSDCTDSALVSCSLWRLSCPTWKIASAFLPLC